MPPQPEKAKARIIIVEDHPMFREHLAHVINRESDLMVCGETDNAPDGLVLIQQQRPQLTIVDLTLKGASGLELIKDLRVQEVDVPALVLSMHDESIYAERAMRAGAQGYITKHEASARVMTAIRTVLAGEIYLEPRLMARIFNRAISADPAATRQPIDRLTDRELEVFELIGRGQTTRQIGTRLNIGLTTIDTYRARIKDKLGLENAAQLHSEAAQWVQLQHRSVFSS